jgi:hypothetical protein
VWGAAQLLRWRRGRFDRSAATRRSRRAGARVLPFLLILVGYTNLKARLVQLHPRIFDAPLARLDALVHFGGGDFVGWLLAVNDQRQWLGILGLVYLFAWVALAMPFAFAFARGGGAAARGMLVALALVYIAGGFLYLALPSLGPAFVARERFAHLAWGLPFQVQESMLAALRAVARDPASPATPFFGIAAFPSLHLATTALGLFAAWRWSALAPRRARAAQPAGGVERPGLGLALRDRLLPRAVAGVGGVVGGGAPGGSARCHAGKQRRTPRRQAEHEPLTPPTAGLGSRP